MKFLSWPYHSTLSFIFHFSVNGVVGDDKYVHVFVLLRLKNKQKSSMLKCLQDTHDQSKILDLTPFVLQIQSKYYVTSVTSQHVTIYISIIKYSK
jgi:hypothetical protein